MPSRRLLIRFESNGRSDRNWGRNGGESSPLASPKVKDCDDDRRQGRYLVGGYVFDTGLSTCNATSRQVPAHHR